jgi:hypothetical protein
MNLRNKFNVLIHKIMVKRVLAAYNKKVLHRLHSSPELNKPVDEIITRKHLELYGRLGYPCSDKWLRLYSNLTGIADYTYLPEDLFFACIERVLNDCNRAGFEAEDKNLLSVFVEDKYLPENILRFIRGYFMDDKYNVLSDNDVNNILSKNHGELIGKVAVASLGGQDVSCYKYKDGKYTSESGNTLTLKWIRDTQFSFVLQKKINQCEFSAQFNRSSANTCRITTLRCPWDGKIVVTKAAMRFGVTTSSVDNMAAGGVAVGLGPNGELGDVAISWLGMKKYNVHPSSRLSFKDNVHPHYIKMCEIVKKQAARIPNFNLLSWDVIADEQGDIKIIEVNQVGQGTDIHQFAYGSFFGEYTEKVIDWVASHKKYDCFKHFRTFNY